MYTWGNSGTSTRKGLRRSEWRSWKTLLYWLTRLDTGFYVGMEVIHVVLDWGVGYIPLHSDGYECGQASKQGPLVRVEFVDRGEAILGESWFGSGQVLAVVISLLSFGSDLSRDTI